MKKSIYLFVTTMFFFLSCSSDPSITDEEILLSEREQQIDTQLEKQDVQLSEVEIDKLRKIEEIAKKYDVDVPEKYGPEFAEHIDVWLNMDLEDAEGFFKELRAYKLYSERSSEITQKWFPKLEAAETKEKHDELYREYQEELAQLKEEMFSNVERYSDKIFVPENNK